MNEQLFGEEKFPGKQSARKSGISFSKEKTGKTTKVVQNMLALILVLIRIYRTCLP